MNSPAVIGANNPSIEYKDRLTAKALILNDKGEVLIINNGLLPGGALRIMRIILLHYAGNLLKN